MMKRGGRPESLPLEDRQYYGNVHNFAHFYGEHRWKGSRYIFNELTKLFNLPGVKIFVERKTILGGERLCEVEKFEDGSEGEIHFAPRVHFGKINCELYIIHLSYCIVSNIETKSKSLLHRTGGPG